MKRASGTDPGKIDYLISGIASANQRAAPNMAA